MNKLYPKVIILFILLVFSPFYNAASSGQTAWPDPKGGVFLAGPTGKTAESSGSKDPYELLQFTAAGHAFAFRTSENRESWPVAWQEVNGKKVPAKVSLTRINESEVGFDVEQYSPGYSLVLDLELTWNTFLGSSSSDFGYGISVDSSGNVYVTGRSNATWGSPVNPHTGDYDVFVAKLNNSGALQWHTFLGSADNDWCGDIVLDGNGNIYVIGQSNATWGSPVNPHTGLSDAFVAKLNNSGTLQWNTFMGSAMYDYGYGIVLDNGGNIYVTGQSNATWGSPVNPHAGSDDAFVAKLNNSGTLQWHTFLGCGASDNGRGIALDSSEHIYVTGNSGDTWGSPVNPHAGSDDAFVARLENSGAVQWNTFLGSDQYDSGWDITVDNSGNAYVTGCSYASWGVPVNPCADWCDAYAAKLNSNGALQWNTFMGSTKAEWGYGIALDSSDNVYVAGESDNITWGDPVHPFKGASDAFVVRLNNSGIRQWNTFLGSYGYDYCWRIALDGSSNIYVTGESPSSWGTPVNPHSGDFDVFVAKMQQKASIEDHFLGTWDGQGVFYRNSISSTWIKLALPADLIAAGDLDGDGFDDLIGIWPGQGGVWVKYSKTGGWAKLSTMAKHIAAGDMNGDGRVDLLGTWDGQGVFFKDSISGTWTKLASPATLITAAEVDGDSKDDLIGIWPTQGGVWVKMSKTGTWFKACSTARDLAMGDMNGNGSLDLLGTWDGQGVFFYDANGATWVKMSVPAEQVTAGDLDGDGKDDLIGLWTSQGGIWVKYSKTGAWSRISTPAKDIATGVMNGGAWGGGRFGFIELQAPMGGYAEGPGSLSEYKDLSPEGPGGWRFASQEQKNLIPQQSAKALVIPGPGQPGFTWVEQKNLAPQEQQEAVKEKRQNVAARESKKSNLR